MNREAQVHKYIHMSELTRSYTMHIFTCKIFQSGYMKIILPPVNYACPHCSWSLPTLNIIINFNFCHFSGYILVSLCGFNLSISNQQWSLAGFHMCNGYLNFLFLKYLLSICSFSIDHFDHSARPPNLLSISQLFLPDGQTVSMLSKTKAYLKVTFNFLRSQLLLIWAWWFFTSLFALQCI